MNVLDIAILLILAFSVGSGLIKGLVKELFSLIGVVLSVLVALLVAPRFGLYLERWIEVESASYATALLLLFLGTLLVVAILGQLLTRLIEFAHLGFVNRLLGGAFGLVRGVLVGLIVLVGLTLVLDAQTPLLATSRLAPFFAQAGRHIAPLLPEGPRAVLLERIEGLPEGLGDPLI